MSRHLFVSLCSAPLLATCAKVTVAAEPSVEQVRERGRGTSGAANADLSGKDLSEIDLSGVELPTRTSGGKCCVRLA